MGSRVLSALGSTHTNEMFGKLILTALMGAQVAIAALGRGRCQNAEAGWIHESCSLECNQADGTCHESLVIEDCECKNNAQATFQSFTFNYENGRATTAVGRRKTQARVSWDASPGCPTDAGQTARRVLAMAPSLLRPAPPRKSRGSPGAPLAHKLAILLYV